MKDLANNVGWFCLQVLIQFNNTSNNNNNNNNNNTYTKKEMASADVPRSPKADASTEYIGFYYQNVVKNQETLKKLQKMGVKSLELETTGTDQEGEEKLPKSMRKTLKQVMDGTLCVITKGGGASPAAIELWERLDLFFFFFFAMKEKEKFHLGTMIDKELEI